MKFILIILSATFVLFVGCGVKTAPSPILPGGEKRTAAEIKIRQQQREKEKRREAE